MRVDPRVARRKFKHQAGLLQNRSEDLRQKGCLILNVAFPHVEAVLLPNNPVHVPMRVLIADRAESNRVIGDQRLPIPYPYLAARSFGIRLDFSDFDQQAPSLTFHHPQSWADLPYDQIPPGLNKADDGTILPIVISPHPGTGRPFLCMRYICEYHVHPQHTDDPWVWYRSDFNLPNLLNRIADVFVAWPIPVVGHEILPAERAALLKG